MKTIKDLTVTVTYRVGLGDVEVPDDVYEGLVSAFDGNARLSHDAYDAPENAKKAHEWLVDNIYEKDAFDWEYEIDDLLD
jgi:hypothetical protein